MTDVEYLFHMIQLFVLTANLAWTALASIIITRKLARIEKEVKA